MRKRKRRQLSDKFILSNVTSFVLDNLSGLKKIIFRPANKIDSVAIAHFKIQTIIYLTYFVSFNS